MRWVSAGHYLSHSHAPIKEVKVYERAWKIIPISFLLFFRKFVLTALHPPVNDYTRVASEHLRVGILRLRGFVEKSVCEIEHGRWILSDKLRRIDYVMVTAHRRREGKLGTPVTDAFFLPRVKGHPSNFYFDRCT